MTATGIALIAGGLATLICFRKVLWTGRGRRGAGTKQRAARTAAIEAPRLSERESVPADGAAVLLAQGGAPEISGAHLLAETASAVAAAPVEAGRAGSDVERRRAERPDTPTGDYWMPVPDSAYAEMDPAGYGLPSGGRDRDVESEPTAVVPTWPPARPFDRIELPRSWSEGSGRRALRATEPHRRPRPRPNPTVYVSRHAAE